MLELSSTRMAQEAYLVLGMAGARLEIIRTHHICSILYRISTLCHISPLKLKQGDKNEAETLFKEVNGDSPVALWMEKTIAHIKCTMIYQQSGEREDNKHAILCLHEALNMNTDWVQKQGYSCSCNSTAEFYLIVSMLHYHSSVAILNITMLGFPFLHYLIILID